MYAENDEPLKEYTLCLTGTSGYIGQHLLNVLKEKGYTFRQIGRSKIQDQQALTSNEIVWSNIDELRQKITVLNKPILINIAGYFVGKHQAHDIEALCEGNIKFPLQMYEAFAKAGCKEILNIGTSWEYDSMGKRNPENLYAALKTANANLLDWFSREYSIKVINLKLNDTYGGNDTRKKLLPLLKKARNEGSKLELGYGSQEINLLNIEDVCEGIISALRALILQKANAQCDMFLLSDETVTLSKLIEISNEVSEKKIEVSFRYASDENGNLRSVWREAPLVPNWRPKVKLKNGLRKYYES